MENKNRIYTIVGLIVAAGLLLSVVLGAVAGGAAGYFMGKRQANKVVEQELGVTGWPESGLNFPDDGSSGSPLMPRRTPFGRLQPDTQNPGALVTDVTPNTPAEKAGLQRGDIILAINDEKVTLANDLAGIVQQYKPGDTVQLTFSRDGSEKSVDVTLGQHPDSAERPYLGVSYTSVSASQTNPGN